MSAWCSLVLLLAQIVSSTWAYHLSDFIAVLRTGLRHRPPLFRQND